jgi:hypothetical protein
MTGGAYAPPASCIHIYSTHGQRCADPEILRPCQPISSTKDPRLFFQCRLIVQLAVVTICFQVCVHFSIFFVLVVTFPLGAFILSCFILCYHLIAAFASLIYFIFFS